MATLEQVMSGTRDAMTVKRVFGDPIEREGLTFIPVASVSGGGGAGEGEGPEEQGKPTGAGSGGGFGVKARPVGAYVIRGGTVEWQPALDVTRLGIAGIVLTAVLALTVRSMFRSRS